MRLGSRRDLMKRDCRSWQSCLLVNKGKKTCSRIKLKHKSKSIYQSQAEMIPKISLAIRESNVHNLPRCVVVGEISVPSSAVVPPKVNRITCNKPQAMHLTLVVK